MSPSTPGPPVARAPNPPLSRSTPISQALLHFRAGQLNVHANNETKQQDGTIEPSDTAASARSRRNVGPRQASSQFAVTSFLHRRRILDWRRLSSCNPHTTPSQGAFLPIQLHDEQSRSVNKPCVLAAFAYNGSRMLRSHLRFPRYQHPLDIRYIGPFLLRVCDIPGHRNKATACFCRIGSSLFGCFCSHDVEP